MTTGYVRVLAHGHPNAAADGRVLEHVFVMSAVLGRALTALEVVHHIDEDKGNNSPKNLMLFASQAEHLLHHAKERALAACGNASFMKCQFVKSMTTLQRCMLERIATKLGIEPAARFMINKHAQSVTIRQSNGN